MGRQAHLARLALGRSPYGPPLLDDDGELFIGPHTHDDDARGYQQQYNDRGHPVNKDTDLANRQLRRAQNEILRVAGVVKTKRDIDPEPHWQSLSHTERKEIIRDENIFAAKFRNGLDYFLLVSGTWWLTSFRNRLLTYQSYAELPAALVLQNDIARVGIWTVFGSGLSTYAATKIIQWRRHHIFADKADRLDLAPGPRSRYDAVDSYTGAAGLHLLDFSIFTVGEWPLRVFSTLKSLHIVPMNADSSVFAMLRLCGPLSLWFPSPPLLLGLTSTCKYALSCLVNPLVIAYLADIVSEAIHTALAASIRTLVAKPDEPDLLSLDAYYSVPTTSVPGIGMQVSAKRRFYGPKTILGCFELSFPAIHRVLWQYLGLPSEIQFRLTPYNEDDLAAASLQRYNAHISSNMNRPPSRRVADNAIRHAAVQEILTEAGVNARDERINISEWARAMTIVLSPSNSTATPDPEDLFGPGTNTGAFEINTSETYEPVAWDGLTTDLHSPPPISFSPFAPITSTAPEEVQNLPHAAANGTQHLDGEISDAQDESHIEAPVVPLQRLLEPADLDTGQSLRPISPPGTPQPGIERAPPLSRASLRPVRRPTEIDDGLDAISDRVNTMKYLKDMLDEPKDPVQHRVTALSNWPVDVLALHGSTLLTSMLMLPVEILITRMIARTYLTNRAGVGTHIVGEGSLARAIWPVSKTLFPGIGLSAGLTLAGSTLAMFAMQGLVGSVIWSLSTRVAIYVGRHCYGWGRF